MLLFATKCSVSRTSYHCRRSSHYGIQDSSNHECTNTEECKRTEIIFRTAEQLWSIHTKLRLVHSSAQSAVVPRCSGQRRGREAFETAKQKIASYNTLVRYDPRLPITLDSDASAYRLGAVILHTMSDGSKQLIAFASRNLILSENNYSQVEKEALSLIFGVSKFHTYLYGCRFILATDHKLLTTIIEPKKGVGRWAVKLAAYDIRFHRTDDHSNAHRLSRLPLILVQFLGYSSEPAVFNLQQITSLLVTVTKVAATTRGIG